MLHPEKKGESRELLVPSWERDGDFGKMGKERRKWVKVGKEEALVHGSLWEMS